MAKKKKKILKTLKKKVAVKIKKKKKEKPEEPKEEVTLRPDVTAIEKRLAELNTLRDLMIAEGISRMNQLEIKIEQTQSELNKIRQV